MSIQSEEGKITQASIPPMQEEPTSPSIPKKHKRIKIQMKERQRISRRLVPNPSIPETILKGDEEEEEIESKEEDEKMPL